MSGRVAIRNQGRVSRSTAPGCSGHQGSCPSQECLRHARAVMAPTATAASPTLPAACGARRRRSRAVVPKAPSALLGRARGRSSSPPPVRAASQPLSLSSLMQRIAPGQHEQAEEGSSAGDGGEAASEVALERRTADTVGSAIAGYIAHTLRRTTTPARVRASLDGQCQLVAAEADCLSPFTEVAGPSRSPQDRPGVVQCHGGGRARRAPRAWRA